MEKNKDIIKTEKSLDLLEIYKIWNDNFINDLYKNQTEIINVQKFEENSKIYYLIPQEMIDSILNNPNLLKPNDSATINKILEAKEYNLEEINLENDFAIINEDIFNIIKSFIFNIVKIQGSFINQNLYYKISKLYFGIIKKEKINEDIIKEYNIIIKIDKEENFEKLLKIFSGKDIKTILEENLKEFTSNQEAKDIKKNIEDINCVIKIKEYIITYPKDTSQKLFNILSKLKESENIIYGIKGEGQDNIIKDLKIKITDLNSINELKKELKYDDNIPALNLNKINDIKFDIKDIDLKKIQFLEQIIDFNGIYIITYEFFNQLLSYDKSLIKYNINIPFRLFIFNTRGIIFGEGNSLNYIFELNYDKDKNKANFINFEYLNNLTLNNSVLISPEYFNENDLTEEVYKMIKESQNNIFNVNQTNENNNRIDSDLLNFLNNVKKRQNDPYYTSEINEIKNKLNQLKADIRSSNNNKNSPEYNYLLEEYHNLSIDYNDLVDKKSMNISLFENDMQMWKNNLMQIINQCPINYPKKIVGYPYIMNNYVSIDRFSPTLGLANLGATCYMNATLQCLIHTPELTEGLLNFLINNPNIFSNNISSSNNKANNKLSKEYLKILINVFYPEACENIKKTSFKPYDFKELISLKNELFQGVAANDSKDLLCFILETMHEELIIPNNQMGFINLGGNVDNTSKEKMIFFYYLTYIEKNKSLICNTFYGTSYSVSECLKCKIKRYNFQTYNFLNFPLLSVKNYITSLRMNDNTFDPNNYIINLYDCFMFNQKKEILNFNNKMFCNNCNNLEDSYFTNYLYNLPTELIIILNRGKGNADFPYKFYFDDYINLENFVEFKQNGTKYYLNGIITHFGESGMGGHFIAFCRMAPNSAWFKYNDSSVIKCEQNENIHEIGIPYILFYHKF